MQSSHLVRVGLATLAALLLCIGLLTNTGQAHAKQASAHADFGSCYGESCNGNFPQVYGCDGYGIKMHKFSDGYAKFMYSGKCNAIYLQVVANGLAYLSDTLERYDRYNQDANYKANAYYYSMSSQMIGFYNSSTYVAYVCIGEYECTDFIYSYN